MTAALQLRTAPTPDSLKAGLSDAIASAVARLQALGEARDPPPFGVPAGSALPTLEALFGLSEVELEILCLAAGRDIDGRVGDAIHALSGGSAVTADLVERLHGPTAWSALSSGGALRHWSLIELHGNGPLRDRSIMLDERILGFLLGENWQDRRLAGILRTVAAGLGTGAGLDDEIAGVVDALTDTGEAPLLLLSGRDAAARRACLADAAARIGSVVWRIDARDIPNDWTQRHALGVFLDRELALTRSILLIEVEDADAEAGPAARLADVLVSSAVLSADGAVRPERMPQVRFDLPAADIETRRAEWHSALGPRAAALGNEVDRLASHFTMGSAMIQAACATAVRVADGPGLSDSIWAAARIQSRGRLDGLAERIDAHAPWDDLVLPPEQLAILKDMAGHLRQAARVNYDWGWSDKGNRGLGAASLFSGPSGTGKTLAAEILATDLGLDLYRIDLSQTVSKYIGETEKNLSRIFTAAEQSGAILLFDEADALFGKRSEVKDSHDRYANVEVSYLLQRMEAYRGLAVLTTNLKSAVDKAFLRRLRYLVAFPFPDAVARAQIWTRVFPPKTPLDGLDAGRLSRLAIAGGTIRSIALNAAYLAAAEDTAVHMEHVHRAARREYTKIEKPFTGAEAEACR